MIARQRPIDPGTRAGLHVPQGHTKVGGVHRGLGRAVEIDQLGSTTAVVPIFDHVFLDRLSGKQDLVRFGPESGLNIVFGTTGRHNFCSGLMSELNGTRSDRTGTALNEDGLASAVEVATALREYPKTRP